mgnify:CR=1 FL=1
MYEVEVKSKLRNRKEVLEKLESMGCVWSEELHQIDDIFIPVVESFPPPIGRPVLRIRQQNDKCIFTLKVNQTSRQDCIEHELEISSREEMESIIKILGFGLSVTVDKIRIKTNYKDIEIVLDIVKELGEFIEAEKVVTESDPAVRIQIQKELLDFLETLGVTREDQIIDGKYDIMLVEKLNKN